MPTTGSLAALVTGANKGIGLEIVRQLSPKFQGTVYLTARDASRGQEAERTLQAEGLSNVRFLEMDVRDVKSIEKARDFIQATHGGLDILVNNAGIFIYAPSGSGALTDVSPKAVHDTIDTNFRGYLAVSRAMFPLLRSHARVVNISSQLGSLSRLKLPEMKKQLMSDKLTEEDLEQIATTYVQAVDNGDTTALSGYPGADQHGPYAMSKILITALSRLQQRAMDRDTSRSDIVVNACCPGYCATDMSGYSSQRSAAVGADAPVYLATLPESVGEESVKPRGELIYERRVIKWAKETDAA